MQHCLPELYESESTRIANGMKCGVQYRYISHSLMMDGLLVLIIAILLTPSTILMTSGIFSQLLDTAENVNGSHNNEFGRRITR